MKKTEQAESTYITSVEGNYIKVTFDHTNSIARLRFSKHLLQLFDTCNFSTKWLQYPTGNCQVSSFCEIGNLISRVKYNNNGCIEDEDIKPIIRGVIAELQFILRSEYAIVLMQVMLDIESVYLATIKEVFKKGIDFKIESSYTSTNGSDMVLLLIPVKGIDLASHWNIDLSQPFKSTRISTKEEEPIKVKVPELDIPF